MEKISFHKYHAAADDFILIDNRDGKYHKQMQDVELKVKMCNRHIGIGSDGIMELKSHSEMLFEMVVHGSHGEIILSCASGTGYRLN